PQGGEGRHDRYGARDQADQPDPDRPQLYGDVEVLAVLGRDPERRRDDEADSMLPSRTKDGFRGRSPPTRVLSPHARRPRWNPWRGETRRSRRPGRGQVTPGPSPG